MTTHIQMELSSWQLDEDLNIISGIVEWDLYRKYNRGSVYKGHYEELIPHKKFLICKNTKSGVVIRNIVIFVSFTLNKEGQVDVPNQVRKSFKSQLLGVLR